MDLLLQEKNNIVLTVLRHLDIIPKLFMKIHLTLKFISRLILLVLLTAILNGAHGTAHAMENHTNTTCIQAVYSAASTPHDCPCSPDEQHDDHDGCNKCASCACHAPLTMQLFQLVYTPIIAGLQTFTPLTVFPEVFLSLFVPPDSPNA